MKLFLIVVLIASLTAKVARSQTSGDGDALKLPARWEYSPPLISPEHRDVLPSHAQKDPTVVFHEGRWHVFMTVKLADRTVIEYCSFADWKDADASPRVLLDLAETKYFCAPQVFYFSPQKKWYLIYQLGGLKTSKRMMQVAYSTTTNIADPHSWTKAQPMLDSGDGDRRKVGGLDFWIICDTQRAYLFYTDNKGHLWRMWTRIEDFPQGMDHCELAMTGPFFEASHTYTLHGVKSPKYLTIIEADGKRHYRAYGADALDGQWTPLADTEGKPFAGAANIHPAPGATAWTDNISHGELVRMGVDETMMVDPRKFQFVFQGMMNRDKAGKKYGEFEWRIGLLTPADDGGK